MSVVDEDVRIDRIASGLVPAASQLTRIVLRHHSGPITRTEGAILKTLSQRPRRITELAELEGLAQPTTTQLVKRLEERGWVARRRHDVDGRVAMISITDAGADALQALRAEYRTLLAARLRTLGDDELEQLDRAVTALDGIVERLQSELWPG